MAGATGVKGGTNAPGAPPLPGGLPRFVTQACASTFGGPGDPGTGHIGYHGDDLRGKKAFAELNMGTALGNLPYKKKIVVAYKGKYVIVEKLDIGLGGAPCGGHARRIDLWYEVAQELGLSGTDVVSYQLEVTPAEAKELSEKYGVGGINLEKIPGEIKEGIEGAVSWTKELGKILSFIGSSQGWIRIGEVVIGAALLILAIDQITKVGPTPTANLKEGIKGRL